MNNIITKSILYILFSLLLLSFSLFLYNNFFSLYAFSLSLKYSIYELFGLVLYLSQFLIILREDQISGHDLIVNTFICWVLYFISKYFLYDKNIVYIFHNIPSYIFVDRGEEISSKFDILSFDFMKALYRKIHKWDLSIIIPQSSFILLFFNISINNLFKIKFNNQILLRYLIFVLIFLFTIFIWDYNYNTAIFLLSIIAIKGFGGKVEKY